MQTKTKSILLISGVLIIGIIIGALGSSIFRKNMWEDRVARFRTPEGFTERIIDRIGPDPDKREAVEKILLEQHQKIFQKFEHSRMEMEAHVDSVLMKIKPLLNEEQFKRAKLFLKRRPPRPGRPEGPEREFHRPPRPE
jgi:hypothetical protein